MSDHRSQGERFEDAMKVVGEDKLERLMDVSEAAFALVQYFLYRQDVAGKELPELVLPATGKTTDGEPLNLEIIVRRKA